MRSAPRWRAIRTANWPTGPSPSTASVPPSATPAYCTACQAVGRMSDRNRNCSSGVFVGHLDRTELGLRHPQVLSLAAGHRAVQRGVAEQRGALALGGDLGGLALGEQAALAHPAMPTGDVERNHHPVTDGEVGDVGADLLDHAHRLVAKHVAGLQVGPEHAIEVQVRTADGSRGNPDDRIVALPGSPGRVPR